MADRAAACFVERRLSELSLPLELNWVETPDRRMPADRVVEAFDVIERVRLERRLAGSSHQCLSAQVLGAARGSIKRLLTIDALERSPAPLAKLRGRQL